MIATGCFSAGPFAYGARGGASQERPAQGFDAVALEGAGAVSIHPGQDFRVVVTAGEDLQKIIETRVEDGVLILGFSG